MPLYKAFDSNNYRCGIWKTTETLDQLLAILPAEGSSYKDQLNAFRSDSRKIEWLAVRVLLYTLTGEPLEIQYHPNGKPYVDGLYLSISHTKGYVAVITSRSHTVGVDIEKTGERVHRIAHKFTRDDEHLPDDPAQQTNALLLIWSAKEVMFKCMNEEGVDFREHLRVALHGMSDLPITGKEYRTPRQQEYSIHYMLHPDFVMTWTIEESSLY